MVSPCPAGIAPEVHALLCNQMDAIADRVAEGDSIAQSGPCPRDQPEPGEQRLADPPHETGEAGVMRLPTGDAGNWPRVIPFDGGQVAAAGRETGAV